MRAVLSAGPSHWVFVSLWVAAATVLLADANRFLPPEGEKYTDRVAEGGCDLLPSFCSAYALIDGQNPYHYSLKHLPNPWGEDEKYKYQYPPTHFLVYVPLVVYVGDDFLKLARIQFYITLAAALLVSLAILDLAAAAAPLSRELHWLLVPLFVLVLSLNPGGQMGLERGQSDMTSSALCWSAAALFLRRRFMIAAFLAAAAALLKGYGVPFCAGLVLAGLRRDAWRPTLAGLGLAFVLLLLPVIRFLPDAIAAFPTRANMFWSSWNNQSLFNLLYVLSPRTAMISHRVLLVPMVAVTLGSWWRLRQAFDAPREDQAVLLALFTTASLILILAFSLNSIVYNVALILPGGLLLALIQGRLSERPFGRVALGSWLSLTLFALCVMSLPRWLGRAPHARELPAHALGQLALLLVVGVISWRGLPKAAAS